MTYPKVDFLPADEQTGTTGGVAASPRFPEIEERILRYWAEDGTFLASVEAREAGEDGSNEFVFYDGPPFANGLPHYGHLLTGYVKDLIPRYQTMRGRRVERRFGWDCHGLPAELEAQRVLGLRTKADILELGIEKFNEACRESVLKYTDEWQEYVTRQARWVDFEHDYKTLNPSYMESVSGRSRPCTTRAWSTRACACCPTAGTTRRRCPTTSCGWTRRSTSSARTPRSPSGSRWRPASGCWRGRRRRGRCPATWRWRSGRTSTTSTVEHEGRALPPRRGPARCLRARAGGGRGRAGRGPRQGQPSSSAGATPRSSTSSPTRRLGHRAGLPGHPERPRHHRRRHRRRAHGARLR